MAVAEFCRYFGKIVRQSVAIGGKIHDDEIVAQTVKYFLCTLIFHAQKSRFFNHMIICFWESG
jgi:hypothetical protein